MGHCLVCEHKSFREKSLVPPAHLVFVLRIFYIFANGSRAIISCGTQLLILVTKNSEYLTQLKLSFPCLLPNIIIDLRHARKGSNAVLLYFEGLPNCAMVIDRRCRHDGRWSTWWGFPLRASQSFHGRDGEGPAERDP